MQQAAKVNESIQEPGMRLLDLKLRAIVLAVQVARQRLRGGLDQLACELLEMLCGRTVTPVTCI